VVGGESPTGMELRWDGPNSGTEAVEAGPGVVVGWHIFGRFEPDDAVVFGTVPPKAVVVRHVPGQGLPRTEVSVVGVPGATWSAFAFSSYAAIGIVEARGSNATKSWERLIVPQGCGPAREFVEAFLAARRAGEGAEAFLTPSALHEFGKNGVAPLYVGEHGGSSSG
jgi:hypothetical protein